MKALQFKPPLFHTKYIKYYIVFNWNTAYVTGIPKCILQMEKAVTCSKGLSFIIKSGDLPHFTLHVVITNIITVINIIVVDFMFPIIILIYDNIYSVITVPLLSHQVAPIFLQNIIWISLISNRPVACRQYRKKHSARVICYNARGKAISPCVRMVYYTVPASVMQMTWVEQLKPINC